MHGAPEQDQLEGEQAGEKQFFSLNNTQLPPMIPQQRNSMPNSRPDQNPNQLYRKVLLSNGSNSRASLGARNILH